jgi:uncharacterized lipoprotein
MKRALLLLAVVALAACGGESTRLSKDQYQAKLHAAFVAAQSAAAHRAGSDQVKALKAVASSYAGLAATLKGARPPVPVQKLNDQLVAGAAKQAKSLGSLASKLERTPRQERARVLAEFDANRIEGEKLFNRAVAALEAKGYRFRTSAGT